MKKTVIRFYDENEEYSMSGDCYFLVLPKTWEKLSDEEFEACAMRVTSMSWQKYTHYAVGTVEIKKSEMFWSEIMLYEWHEVKIDVERVQDLKKYKLPMLYRMW